MFVVVLLLLIAVAGLGSGETLDEEARGEDGLWDRAKAALLSWNRVRSFAAKLQVKLREVTDLRHELEQLLHALKAADATPSS